MTETPVTPLIEARALTRILHEGEIEVTLVRGVSLSIRPGEFVSITGPSGSGKSSLLYLLGLLDQPTAGDVLLEGQSTAGLPATKLSRLRLERLGFIFQFHFLLPEFTILDNVLIPMRKLGRFHGAEMHEQAQSILEHLGMADQQNKHPSQLSGGQRQRAAIARALANGPKVLLADEPTGNLDSKNSRVVHDIFRKLVDERQASVVMVTHDLGLAQETDRRIHLIDGRLADTPRA